MFFFFFFQPPFSKAFLSNEMMYSCALWTDQEGGVLGDITSDGKSGDLEVAQLRKIHHVLQRARVQPGDRLLEFGTGWGGLAIEVSVSKKFDPNYSRRKSCVDPVLTGCPLLQLRSRY